MSWADKALPADPELELDDDGPTVAAGRTPAWLVEHAVDLVHGIREREPQAAVERITDDLSWAELRGLAVTLAALVPGDVDAARALEWVAVAPKDWTDVTVVQESGRWDAGQRDHVAARGRGQWLRRYADAANAAARAASGGTS